MDRSDIGQDGADFTSRTVNVDLTFTASTAGAVPSSLTRSNGITSVVLTSTEYLVTFQDVYQEFLNAEITIQQASFSAGAGCYGVISSANVGAGSTSPNTVGVTFLKGSDGSAVVAAAGDIVRVRFNMKR
jgi:hypothetical protein